MKNDHLSPRDSLISAGEEAPDFTLLDQNKNPWRLADSVKQGVVVLCFFPFAFTSVCTTEMKCVNEEFDMWSRQGAQVVGVSADSFAALKAWADQLSLRQTLLSDLHRQVCQAYGLYWPEMNVARRGTVVIAQSDSGAGNVKWSDAREPGSAVNWDDIVAAIS